ncbi:hypothetical protein Lal_00002331 [Lupinus albus]|nr:hypothetical protein Lal_00002331 [Lupinus albus]
MEAAAFCGFVGHIFPHLSAIMVDTTILRHNHNLNLDKEFKLRPKKKINLQQHSNLKHLAEEFRAN